jgi:Uri superfamily endonuclease
MLGDAMQGCSALCNALLTSNLPYGGTYTLLLWLSDNQRLRIGRLGYFAFPRGYYTYTGSAKRGLTSRLHRHIHGAATQHWHIDYLRPYVRVLDWQPYAL